MVFSVVFLFESQPVSFTQQNQPAQLESDSVESIPDPNHFLGTEHVSVCVWPCVRVLLEALHSVTWNVLAVSADDLNPRCVSAYV